MNAQEYPKLCAEDSFVVRCLLYMYALLAAILVYSIPFRSTSGHVLTSVSSADTLEVYVLLSMNVVKASAASTVPQDAVALYGPSPSPLSWFCPFKQLWCVHEEMMRVRTGTLHDILAEQPSVVGFLSARFLRGVYDFVLWRWRIHRVRVEPTL